jgi:CxxC motif-containing protein
MTKKTVTCICCPLGCRITVDFKGNKIKTVGQQCKQGETYAIQEVKDPRRVLTTTIRINDGKRPMLPVRSEKEIQKKLIKKCVKKLSKMKVKAPVKCGEVICKNILDTGVNIIATRNMEIKKV